MRRGRYAGAVVASEESLRAGCAHYFGVGIVDFAGGLAILSTDCESKGVIDDGDAAVGFECRVYA